MFALYHIRCTLEDMNTVKVTINGETKQIVSRVDLS